MGTVVVTGSASGIGAACAARMAAEGHRVLGVDRGDADVVADLGTVEGRAHAIRALGAAAGGRLDGLVTCAGLGGVPSRAGSLVVSVNYFGTVHLLEGLRPLLTAAPGAAAVAVSSNSVTIQPGVPVDVADACLADDEPGARRLADTAGSVAAYPATKLAVARYVRTRAPSAAWAGAGVRLNAVAPGMVDTPLVAEGRADPAMAPALDLLPLPLGRAGRPDEIAGLVALLLGPDGGFFCGSVLLVDGGSEATLRPLDWPAPWAVAGGWGRAARTAGGPAHASGDDP